MNPWVIETESLTRRFGSKTALDDLSLRVARGGVHAIVGANGAGKSTLFRILLGFMRPDAGSARVLGLPAEQLRAPDRARIGFVNEEHHLPGWMPVRELVALQRQQYAARWREAPLNQVLSFFQVLPQQRVSELSRGERAGLSLGLALAQGPELLLLDEPTLGLDVVAKRAFLDALMQVGLEQDCTIIYCSHLMDEIERLAEQLIVIERGRLRYQCEPEALCQRVRLVAGGVSVSDALPARPARPAEPSAPGRPDRVAAAGSKRGAGARPIAAARRRSHGQHGGQPGPRHQWTAGAVPRRHGHSHAMGLSMLALFRAEWRRLRGVALAGLALHGLPLIYLARLLNLPQQSQSLLSLFAVFYLLLGLLFGAWQPRATRA